jgi:hypothetical protein
MPHLEELSLDHTGVTDKGVDSLKSISALKFLNLYHTTVSKAGFKTLETSLPQCRIIYDDASSNRLGRTE